MESGQDLCPALTTGSAGSWNPGLALGPLVHLDSELGGPPVGRRPSFLCSFGGGHVSSSYREHTPLKHTFTFQVLGSYGVACLGRSLEVEQEGFLGESLGGFSWGLESLGRLWEEPLSQPPSSS